MEWKEVIATDYCYKVADGTHDSPKRQNRGRFLITSKHIKGPSIDFDNAYYISEDDYQKIIKRSKIDKWDVIVSMIGEYCGFCYLEDSDFTDYAVKNVGILKVGERIKSLWLYYYLNSPDGRNQLKNTRAGSSQPYISLGSLRNLLIPEPPRDVMERTVSILSSLDRKIELNNKINADLEEMAQAIFKNWFVDFEPFKDGKFVDSELGMIPEGWKVGTIGDIVEFQNGFTFSSKDFSENGEYKIITIKSVQDGCLVTEGSSKVTEYPTKMPAYCKLQSGDILLSLTGNVGRCCLVTETNLLLNQRVAKIKAKECYDNSFSYALFRLKETKELLISISRGTAQANLSPVEASKLPMVIPSEDARKSFSMISDSIMNKIISIHIENSRLSLLRDTLLPRLMSGELEVPE